MKTHELSDISTVKERRGRCGAGGIFVRLLDVSFAGVKVEKDIDRSLP
jgi:hypothetical protein